MAACPVIPIRKTLYSVEADLLALLECVDTVAPEHEADYLAALGTALAAAKDKRDSVARYMSHLESQIQLSRDELERIRERRADLEMSLERLKTYVARLMDQGGVRKLEGETVTFTLRKCPPAVELVNEAAIPDEYRNTSVTLPSAVLDRVLDAVPEDLAREVLDRVRDEDVTIDKRAVRSALENGRDVAGARIASDRYALVRR